MKMNLSRAAVALACFALAGPALSQTMPSPDPETAQAGTYNIEPAHTRVLFSILHMGFTHYYGDFTGVSGKLSIDPKHVGDASVQVSFPTESISTTNAKLDGELKSGQWLDATAFPTITFISKHVTRTGPSTAKVEGDLTLHGVTHPVVLDVKFNAAGPNPFTHKPSMGFDATGHLKRSDFGVKAYVPLISDDIDIIISAAFEKAN
jgi:polyisoprenoid-binding protein YceI